MPFQVYCCQNHNWELNGWNPTLKDSARTNFGPYLEMKSRKSLCVIKSVCIWVRERDKVWICVSLSVLESVCVGEWERKSESVRWNGCFLQYSNVTSFFFDFILNSVSVFVFKDEEKICCSRLLISLIGIFSLSPLSLSFSSTLPLSSSLSVSLFLSPFKLIKELTCTFLFRNILVIVSSPFLCLERSSIQIRSKYKVGSLRS